MKNFNFLARFSPLSKIETLNHPSMTIFVNCVYGCQKDHKSLILTPLHVPKVRYSAYSNLSYIAYNH